MNTYEKFYKNAERQFVAYGEDYLSAAGWYLTAHNQCREIADYFNTRIDIVCAVVACLSPMVRWQLSSGAYPNLNGAVALFHAQSDDVFTRVNGFNTNKSKALRIILEGDTSILSGTKVRAFFDNLLNPLSSNEVTIDSWMFRLVLNDFSTATKDSWVKNRTTSTRIAKRVVADLAKKYGYSPLDMQAILWEIARNEGEFV